MSHVRMHYCCQVTDPESRLHELIRRRSGDGRLGRRAPIPPRFYLCICITLWHSARAYGVFYPARVAGDLRYIPVMKSYSRGPCNVVLQQ